MTNTIYEAGFNSSDHFYGNTNNALKMTPLRFRGGGTNTNIFFAIAKCSLGSILVAQSKKGVCSILIGDDPTSVARELQNQFSKDNLISHKPGYEDIVAKVVGLVEQPKIGLDLPLDIRGTAFQQLVWKALQHIPHGSTTTYIDVAKKIGMPKAARAVAQACASNVLAVVIPCHRVIKTNGSLSGYRWGIEQKSTLLEREARA